MIKNKFLMKNLTDLHKTVETGVDPGLTSQAVVTYWWKSQESM